MNQPYCQKRLFCFFEKGKLFYVEYNLRLFIYLLFQNFDVVCGIDLDTTLPTIAVAKLKGKKRYRDWETGCIVTGKHGDPHKRWMMWKLFPSHDRSIGIATKITSTGFFLRRC